MSVSRAQDFKSRLEKATTGNYYVYVSKKDGKFRTTQLRISGAEKMFAKVNDFIYCNSLRICGVRTEVHEYLVSPPYRFEESQVVNFLKNSYSVSSSATQKAEMDAEISRISANRSSMKKTDLSLDNIINIAKAVNETKKNRPTTPVPSTPKPAPPKVSPKDLKARVAALPKEKVLDFSSFDATKKIGIKTVNATSRSNKHPLASSEKSDLNRVVFDFSKDKSIAVAALVSFGYSEEKATTIVNSAAKSATSTSDLSKVATTSPKRK
jgi:hypothetical protein